MRKVIAGVVVGLMLALSACGPSVTAGTVVDKNSAEQEITEQQCDTEYKTKKVNGKTKRVKDKDCEEVGTGEFETAYTLTLKNEDGETGDVEVSEDEFNSVDEGDHFDSDN